MVRRILQRVRLREPDTESRARISYEVFSKALGTTELVRVMRPVHRDSGTFMEPRWIRPGEVREGERILQWRTLGPEDESPLGKNREAPAGKKSRGRRPAKKGAAGKPSAAAKDDARKGAPGTRDRSGADNVRSHLHGKRRIWYDMISAVKLADGFRAQTTKHLFDRMEQRDVSPAQVINTLKNPDRIEHRDNGSVRLYKGRIVVVLAPDGRTLLTTWRGKKQKT